MSETIGRSDSSPLPSPATSGTHFHQFNHHLVTLSSVIVFFHSVKKATQWQNIPSADIINSARGPIYDSPHLGDRLEVQLDKFDLLDNAGAELSIYNKEGYRIPRRTPLFSPNRLPCGLLVALDRARDLFGPPGFESDLELEEPSYQPPKIWMYPQAFTKTHGHLQANTVPYAFKNAVAEINNAVALRITKTPDSDDDSDDDSDAEYNGSDVDTTNRAAAAVFCISFQIYNSFIHQVRRYAADHDAQMGTVGNALSGSHATGTRQKRIAQRMKASCEKKLPHEHFEQRSNQEKVPTDLRLEVVTTIDVGKLKSGFRGGRYPSRCYNPSQTIILTPIPAESTPKSSPS
jgi:hypothetical protein